MARLQSFTLANFRSYREATLRLGAVTLLVGANASGKSNLIEGLQMLSWLARGLRLEDVFRAVQEAELTIRGHPAQLMRDGENSFSFACRIRLPHWNSLSVKAPWTPTPFWDIEGLKQWLREFPQAAMHGRGMGDLSIIKEWERQCELHRSAESVHLDLGRPPRRV